MFKPFGFVKNHGHQGTGLIFPIYIYIETFKNLLVRNHWTDFYITWKNVPLLILYQDYSSRHDLSKNMAARGRGLFSLYICLDNFNNPFVRNHRADFNTTLQECFFSNRLPRLFKSSRFSRKHGCQGAGLIFPMYLNRKLKIFLSETTGPISF